MISFKNNKVAHVRFVLGMIGILGLLSYVAALVWESTGAVPCILCQIERLLFAGAGIFALMGALFYQKFFKAGAYLSSFLWLASLLTLVYHFLIQMRWIPLPALCRASVPMGSIEEMERFLSTTKQVSCDTVEFTVLGLPPTFYLMGVVCVLLVICGWILWQIQTRKSNCDN
jgi:disulfide bond formation protein DsbB